MKETKSKGNRPNKKDELREINKQISTQKLRNGGMPKLMPRARAITQVIVQFEDDK